MTVKYYLVAGSRPDQAEVEVHTMQAASQQGAVDTWEKKVYESFGEDAWDVRRADIKAGVKPHIQLVVSSESPITIVDQAG